MFRGFFSWNKDIYSPTVRFQGELAKFCRNMLQLLPQFKNFFIELLLGQEILNIWKSPFRFGGNNFLLPLSKIFIILFSSVITCSTPQLSQGSPLEKTLNFKHWFRPNSAQNVAWMLISSPNPLFHTIPYFYTDFHTPILVLELYFKLINVVNYN